MFTIELSSPAGRQGVRGFFDRILRFFIQDFGNVKYQVAKDVFDAVVDATPVDTGRARASWVAGIEGHTIPKGLDLTIREKGFFGDPWFSAPHNIGPNEEYEIINDVPYLVYVNLGYPQPATRGCIDEAVSLAMQNAGTSRINLRIDAD